MQHDLTRRAFVLGSLATLAGCRMRSEAPPPVAARPQAPAAAPAALPVKPTGQWYELAFGDTFHGLSKRSGVALDQLLAANRGVDIRQLHPGDRVWIPTATPAVISRLVATRPKPGDAIDSDDDMPGVAADGYVLVPRSAWTSEKVAANHNLMNGVQRLTVHHTGEHAGLANVPVLEVLRRIERYHRKERGWCAIGYHYIIGRDGRVYEGRPTRYQGAHVLGENEHNVGISVCGDFMKRLPNAHQMRALESVLVASTRTYGLPRKRVYGHRDLNRSLCPGDALYAWIKQWKQA